MQCRVCRRSNCKEAMDMGHVTAIDGKTLYDYFNDCTQLKATNKDNLPTTLCMKCTLNLQQAYNFRQEAIRSDSALRKAKASAKSKSTLLRDEAVICVKKVEIQNEDLSVTKENESSLSYEISKESEMLEDIDDVFTLDVLLAAEDIRPTNNDDNIAGVQAHSEDLELSVTASAEKSDRENLQELVQCKYCYKKIEAGSIMEHEKRHVYRLKQQRKYICSYCSREFRCLTAVEQHEQKVHLTKKREQEECPICQKVFDVTYLKKHIAQVHKPERKFACEICGDLFKSSGHLLSHKQLHLARKYPCTVCNKRFVRQGDLKIHMRMHTGEMPYQCHLCESRFKIKGALNYHLQRHAGIKRVCKVCGKEYNRIEQLKIHSYTHTGMPFRCPECNFRCVKRLKFKTHLKNRHDKVLTEDELCAMFKANTGRYPRIIDITPLADNTD